MSRDKELIRKFNQHPDKREELLDSLNSDEISNLIITNTTGSKNIGFNLFCSALNIKDEDKLFDIIENILPRLNRDELSVRELQDFFSRLCIELNKKSLVFVVRTAYLCYGCISTGDSRAIFYKDILPICLKLLSRNEAKSVEFDSVIKPCKEYRQDIINLILKKPFCISTLTNLVSMFKDIELSQAQQSLLITKISENICQVSQNDISNLALVTFQIASYNQIIIPLLALDKYFLKRRYKYEFSELETTPDSVEETSSEGTIQAEETVIYHFQSYAEFTTLEKDITNALKTLEYAPNLILSPFLSIILVSIAKISSSVHGNFRLNQSTILPFMKQMFKFNEEHRNILKTSGWARTIDPVDAVNTEPLLRILKQNTCGLKQDLALNGLFGLSFLLLKTKSSTELNKFAVEFLNEIIRNRPEFTSDIMHIIVKMLFCEKNKGPIIECFSSFVQNRYLDIKASEPALRKLIEDLTELDLDTALSIESVIFTAITKSVDLRDLMIDIMKKAMYQRNVLEIRKMAVLSFCIMLRKFTKARSAGNQPRFSHNISMFSLTQSQIAVNSTSNKNVRQAEIIMLEILGLLRRCFSENKEIKVMLYESLFNSISANSDIIPYIVEFLDSHFRMYFECDNDEDREIIINFEKLFKSTKNGEEFIVMDELGHLLKFIINCMIMTTEQHEKLNCDIEIYEKILKKLIEKSLSATLDNLHVFSAINNQNSIIMSQFLNCLEALMIYCFHKIKDDSENITKIMMLFAKHQKIQQKAKKMLENHKKAQKSDKNVSVTKKNEKIEFKLNCCIWNLRDCCGFLRAIFNDNGNEKMNEMKQDKDFCKFVLETTAQTLKSIETSSDYTKIKYSRSVFESFLHTSMILYQQLNLDTFKVFYESYSAECAASMVEAFNYAICGMETSYCGKKDKWIRFLKMLTKKSIDDYESMLMEVIERIQKLIEWGFEVDKVKQDFVSSGNGSTVLNNLFGTLEVLYRKLEDERNYRQCFNWILGICKKTSIKHKSLATCVIKLLMNCISQHENSLLIDCIAHKIATCFKYRRVMNEPESFGHNNLSIIGKQTTIDEAFTEFLEFMKAQLNVIDIYIKRANSFNAYARLDFQESRHETFSNLQQIETAICMKLVTLGKSIERIGSANFPVTTRNIEKIVGIVNVYYKCLESIMKHFRKHYDIKNINYQCIGIEELIKYSKKFAICIYGIAPYIEATVDTEFNNGKDKKEIRIKKRDLILNKATKLIPRMIFLIETYNKSVNIFDTSAKTMFNKYLHAGEIRDFHIRNSILKDALETTQTTARSQNLNDVDDDESTNVSNINDEASSDEENIQPKQKATRKRRAAVESEISSTSESDEAEARDEVVLSEDESVHEIKNNKLLTKERFEKNVRIMAKKTNARRGRSKKN
ncbi:hypothetical protein ACKWTF_006642 [Chironomus riparius]